MTGSLPKEIPDNQVYPENRIALIKPSLPANTILLFSGGFSQESYKDISPGDLFLMTLSFTEQNPVKRECTKDVLLTNLPPI